MFEAIGLKTTGSVTRVAATRPASPVQAPTPETTGSTAAAATPVSDPTALARSMAASPPVNTERVSEIRAAIAKGTFPLLPSTIADQMIALKMAWNPHDKA